MATDFIPDAYKFQMDEAVEVTCETTKGFNNCFSVKASNGHSYRVVNFYLETLETLMEGGMSGKGGTDLTNHVQLRGLTWPIQISILDEDRRICVINDPRIDDGYYLSRFCEICCPDDLLTIPQRLATSRKIAREEVSYSKSERDGMVVRSEVFGYTNFPNRKDNKS